MTKICTLPWMHLETTPLGEYRPCCLAEESITKPDGSAYDISKGDTTVLYPNVTFHMIAVMQFGEWGVESSHSIRITDSGCEKFCDFPSDLFVKE